MLQLSLFALKRRVVQWLGQWNQPNDLTPAVSHDKSECPAITRKIDLRWFMMIYGYSWPYIAISMQNRYAEQHRHVPCIAGDHLSFLWQVCRCSHLGENAFQAKVKCNCWSWRWCCAWSCWRFAKAASMSVLTRPAIAWHSGASCATLRYSFATTSRPRKCFSNFSLPPSSGQYDQFQSKACKEITRNESVRYLEKRRFVLHPSYTSYQILSACHRSA